jgi:hypothetical protein
MSATDCVRCDALANVDCRAPSCCGQGADLVRRVSHRFTMKNFPFSPPRGEHEYLDFECVDIEGALLRVLANPAVVGTVPCVHGPVCAALPLAPARSQSAPLVASYRRA